MAVSGGKIQILPLPDGTQRYGAQSASHFSHKSSAHQCTVTQLDQILCDFSSRSAWSQQSLGKGKQVENTLRKEGESFPHISTVLVRAPGKMISCNG